MNFKKYYPFIVPTIALLLVIFLAFRWYNLRTQRDEGGDQTQVEIENLTEEEVDIVQGTDDVSTVPLEREGEQMVSGRVRYTIQDDRVLLNVSAELEQQEGMTYQVWIRPEGQDDAQKAFVLAYGKGGYVGSAALSTDKLPLEIIISEEMNAEDDQVETPLLRGMIEDIADNE
jgi:hypothetical protein